MELRTPSWLAFTIFPISAFPRRHSLRLGRTLILWAMLNLKLALALCCSLIVSANAFAQRTHTPEPGSAERAAIMDAIRGPAQKDLKQTAIFSVDRLRVA